MNFLRNLPVFVSLVASAACGGDPTVNVNVNVNVNGNGNGGASASSAGGGSAGEGTTDGGSGSASKSDASGLDGSSADGKSSTCSGNACETGSIFVEAGVDHCPEILATSVTRSDGQTSVVLVAAADRDGDHLSYQWTSPTGQFSASMTLETTYTCAQSGQQTLTVTVSDGFCQATGNVVVTCP
jgi:hypothetical protein